MCDYIYKENIVYLVNKKNLHSILWNGTIIDLTSQIVTCNAKFRNIYNFIRIMILKQFLTYMLNTYFIIKKLYETRQQFTK